MVDNLEFGVDDDERLWIKSGNSKRQRETEERYRVKRTTVTGYLLRARERHFRANHGWFARVYDHILLNNGELS